MVHLLFATTSGFVGVRKRAESELRFLEGLHELEQTTATRLGPEVAARLMREVRARLGLEPEDQVAEGLVPSGGEQP